MFNPCFPLWRVYLLLLCWVNLFPSISSRHLSCCDPTSICWFIQSCFLSSFVATMLLSERIYPWKLSMTVKRLLWLSMWFLLYNLWYKRLRSKCKYNLFIVLWPRTKVCHHQSWFTLCTFIVIHFAHCKLNYMKGSCCLLWLVLW
jgi:hypothetical protein